MVTLETKQLTLRMLRESDIDAYAEMVFDPEVMRKPSRYIVIVATERSHASRRRK